MANYNDLITAIDSVIKTNNRREITGQLLQNVLNTMVGSLGENYQLAGFATPTTNPHQPDQNVFYVASQAGVYTQFDNIVLGDGISFLMWKNGAWTSQTIANVTQSWVQQNFVSKEWFRKVFRVYDEDGLEIVPNDMDSVVDNIKAMVGLWTNEYLSALGMGRDGGGTVQTLAQLNDVQLGTLENGDALVYNTAIHKWENKQIQTGVDMSVVWAAFAANTNEQINASHLATALSGYVTSANLSTMLNDYATKAWAGQNFITVEWFDKLFQLYNGNEAEANKIAPNGALPVDQTQLNIEAMFGFWTKKYISSLGQGDDGSAGSGDVTWALLASPATDGRTIHSSYIAAALAGYATQNWVQQQGYITSAQLSALEYLQTITGGDEVATFTTNKGTETVLDFSHEHSWFELLDKPDTIAGLGVVLSASDIPNLDWSKITTGKPSTLAGYGITDAVAFVAIGGVNYSPVSGVVTLPVYTSTQVDALARLKTLALSDDGVLSFTHQDDSTTLVDFTHEHSFLELLDRPETIKGYGITDAITTANIGSQSVNYATSAGSAGSATTAGSTNKLTTLADITWGANYLQFKDLDGNYVGNSASAISNPTADWYHHIVMNHGNSAGYFVDMAICFHSNDFYYRRIANGSAYNWVRVIDSSNIGSQSVSYATSAGSATSAGNADTLDGYHESAFLHLSGGTMSGAITFSQQSTTINFTGGEYLDQYGNFWFAANSGEWSVLSSGSVHRLTVKNSTGNVGIGNSNPSYKLDVAGSIGCSNLYSTGAVSALSDIRHKEIVRNTNLRVDQIAAMRSVIYRKKDSNDNTLYAGSIAQDWQSILPQVVSVADNDEHTQSLQYGVAALIAVITTARKVAEHERRIADLERENERLKEIINNLNVA